MAAGRTDDDRGAALGRAFVARQNHEIQHARPGHDVVDCPGSGLLRHRQRGRQRGRRAGRGLGLGGDYGRFCLCRRGLGCRCARPQLAQLAIDLGQAVGHRPRGRQILRHRRPSRSIRASPSSGPQDPAA